jgi:hypothetical protein
VAPWYTVLPQSDRRLAQARLANFGLVREKPRISSSCPWAPVIDGVDVMGHPWARARAGQHFQGPLLLGTARDEGIDFTAAMLPDAISGRDFIANLSQSQFLDWVGRAWPSLPAPKAIELYSGHPSTQGLVCSFFGCAAQNISTWYWATSKVIGDTFFHCGSRMGARWLSGQVRH